MKTPIPYLVFCGILQAALWPRPSEAVEYVVVPEGTMIIYVADSAYEEAPEDRREVIEYAPRPVERSPHIVRPLKNGYHMPEPCDPQLHLCNW